MPAPLHLFDAYGIELEYMIVDRSTFAVKPVADTVLVENGTIVNLVDRGTIAWSNELALHVVELKTALPAPSIVGLEKEFHRQIGEIGRLLAPHGARLMPGAMHPFMDPLTEMRLWPHEYNPIYDAFDRIFSCKGHGWANLQSMHINLPFHGDLEFGALHAAIRLVLPIVPALAASSPIASGRATGFLDTRMEVYRNNSVRVPSVAGEVIPEPVFTRAEYEERVLGRIYRDLEPLDPQGVLREEWVNARGAIARFERDSIEIRIIDIQECPAADLAIAAVVVALTRALCEERFGSTKSQKRWPIEPLAKVLLECIRDGERARIEDREYLAALGARSDPTSAGALWKELIGKLTVIYPDLLGPYLRLLLRMTGRGTLASRVLNAGPLRDSGSLLSLCRDLCDCLDKNELFLA